VLLHGRGADERSIIGLADHLPADAAYAAVRAPIAENGGYAWFANRGIGRPIAESLGATITWFRTWLDSVAEPSRPVLLIGFSGGANAAGGLLLADPDRFAGTAVLYGPMPFDAGVPTDAARLAGVPVFLAQGTNDLVIPGDLQRRTRDYLSGDSGAEFTEHRDDSGHQISPGALAQLQLWTAERLAAARATAA
jgi:phospholipase/carboxylesterase